MPSVVQIIVGSLLWLLLFLEVVLGRLTGPPSPSSLLAAAHLSRFSHFGRHKDHEWQLIPRGGSSSPVDEKGNGNEEERYSRQVYTLGARAHGLVRSATVFVDGPCSSGLTYETVKNLALSGIGTIVLVTSQSSHDENYHYPRWDDLGNTYVRGARAELGIQDDEEMSSSELLVEFLRRLNPSLQVEQITREELSKIDLPNGGIVLCVDRPYDTQVQLNRVCRERSLPFVSVETAGVHGRIFSDFGPTFEVHDADGETPMVVPLDRVELSEGDNNTVLLVRSVEGERHDVSKGDVVRFRLSNGDMMDAACIVTKVMTPETILVKLDAEHSSDKDISVFAEEVNANAGSFSREKQKTLVSFSSLEEATERAVRDPSLFTPCDFDKAFDENRRIAVFRAFQTLNDFVKKHQTLPMDEQVSIFQRAIEVDEDEKECRRHWQLFANKCAAKFVPVQCIFGAVAAQECLKAASGLYNPIQQFLQYDCDEVIISDISRGAMESKCADSGLGYIMGEKVVNALRSRKLFVVGAGAIGCELLKNLAAMQAGTKKEGVIIVTDMDTIEKSNLSRQLLFRDGDISKFKSKAAEEAITRLNPAVKIETHTSKVGDSDSGPFDSRFWSKGIHVVLNALDNVEARLYMDAQCVSNQKALVDSGTLGSKGNVQVVVPHLSESYASSADPPDPSIPVCTLKNFPYSISHTIQWGRDQFDGMFVRRPEQAKRYAKVVAFSSLEELESTLRHDLGDDAAILAARELVEDLSVDPSSVAEVRRQAICWAVQAARRLFHDSVVSLLEEHPLDSVDEDGELFWSRSRKPPRAVKFPTSAEETIEADLVDFVRFAARLRIETFLGGNSLDTIVSCEEVKAALLPDACRPSVSNEATSIRSLLQPLMDFAHTNNSMHAARFEKDDESNGHIAFITAASNLRALCYGIPPADVMETRRVAGRIVPAMITTTAFVSALSCAELVKIVQGAPLNRFRNAFINLALPFFAFTAPVPAAEFEGLRGEAYTIWDRIMIHESKKVAASGGLTVRQFLKELKKNAANDPDLIDVASVSYGQYMIYSNFLNEDDDDLLDTDLWTVVQKSVASGDEFDSSFSRDPSTDGNTLQTIDDSKLDLIVVVEDLKNGEEVELPPVTVMRSTTRK